MEKERMIDYTERIKEPWFSEIDDHDSFSATTLQMAKESDAEIPTAGLRNILATQCSAVATIISSLREEDVGEIAARALSRKYFWHVGNRPTMICSAQGFVFIYESSEECLGFPGEATASMSPWPELWRQTEPEPQLWRGVFSLTYDRRILFSKTIRVRTSELPRWKPQITISRRIVEMENE
jgi:hypothetical protein